MSFGSHCLAPCTCRSKQTGWWPGMPLEEGGHAPSWMGAASASPWMISISPRHKDSGGLGAACKTGARVAPHQGLMHSSAVGAKVVPGRGQDGVQP